MRGHSVPYDFSPFLDALGEDWGLKADPLLSAWLADVPADRREWVATFGRLAATWWKDMADFVERPENLPRLAGKGPYDGDPQQVVLPAETWEMLAAVHGSGIWQEDLHERARYAAVYLLNQNGEAGIACSVACTDGLMRLLRSVETTGPGQDILDALHASHADDWLHGAQFVTEIQGGSDAATNAVRAEGPDEEGMYALHGQKWFCSNLTADWWLVTARVGGNGDAGPRDPNDDGPAGDQSRLGVLPRPAAVVGHGAPVSTTGDARQAAGSVGLFLVPRDQPGYTIERLKDKLGTRALPTAEIMFQGARGWPVGALDEGLRNMVAHVLVTSRVHNIVAAAAFLRRAVREAKAYASFREAFGHRIEDFPLVADPLRRLDEAADRAEAGAFACVDLWLRSRTPKATKDERDFARIVVTIVKAVATRRLPGLVHEAMMVLGGNGVEERFTALPRLYRDAAILETWEGPYTLLLDQAWRDARRVGAGRLTSVLAGLGGVAQRMADLLETPPGPAWRDACHDAFDAFETHSLQRLVGGVTLRKSGP